MHAQIRGTGFPIIVVGTIVIHPVLRLVNPARTSLCGRSPGPTRLSVASEIHPGSPSQGSRCTESFCPASFRPNGPEPPRAPVTDSNNAVFLSYAAQDHEAAQRLCATLRAAGIEVW